MLHQPTQQLILPATTQVRTTIQILLMHRALDVVVQAVEGGELSGAEVAFVGLSVPGAFRGDGFDVRVTGESDHRAGDDVVAIKFVDHVVDLLAIEAGGCACARFEAAEEKVSKSATGAGRVRKWRPAKDSSLYSLNGHAGSGRESDFAPRTLNRCTNMSPGMKMLNQSQSTSWSREGMSIPA
jgi:hypothetical protein